MIVPASRWVFYRLSKTGSELNMYKNNDNTWDHYEKLRPYHLFCLCKTTAQCDHCTVWKVSVFGVILVGIFLHSDWITPNTDTFYAVLVTCLQGNFKFKKIKDIIHIYKETRKKAESYFNHYMIKLLVWLTNLGLKRSDQNHVHCR